VSYAQHQRHGHKARPRVRVAVLTSSDSRGTDSDDSGRLIEELVAKQHEVVGRLVVRDDPAALRHAADRLLAKRPDVLIVNGGTGISPRDVSVEAFRSWFEKELPGFGERFRALSAESIGSGAWLSRATAATVRRKHLDVLLFLLPGSPEACRLAVERLVLPELSHAVSLLQGVRPHG
jgi:molybdopterin adenylyltransferase